MRRLFTGHIGFTVIVLLLFNNILFAQNGVIIGQVKSGMEILPGATVSLGNMYLMTNNDGRFSISLKPGNYTISVTHVGYKKAERTISVPPGVTIDVTFELIADEQLGEVVMIGSRSLIKRSNLNTPVPVNVFSSSKLNETGQQDLAQMLNYTVPSINAGRQAGALEPVTLRGLDPHHLLILINGIRYYNTAWINNGVPKSNMSKGSAGNDLSSIPFSAIDKIELLPDGATAQYGSDAIAGVINIRLKESIDQTSVRLHAGQYYVGDGLKLSMGFNSGVALKNKRLPGKEGFINYSADLWYRGSTSRGGEFTGSIYNNYPPNATAADSVNLKAIDDSILNARGLRRSMFNGYNGNDEVKSAAALINGAYPLGKYSSLFWTGSINNKNKKGRGSYRYPKNTSQVNTMLYPDGFRPNSESRNLDFLLMAGIKSSFEKRWHWELSTTYGSNANFQYVNHSNNASQYVLGKDAPTEFYLGNIVYSQNTNNISFTKELAGQNHRLGLCNLTMGAEWRMENYRQRAGEEASWKDYDSTGPRQGGAQPSIGSINPGNVISKNRSVLSGYIDLETEINTRFLIDLATRYEHYTDFGGNFAGKVAARYKVAKNFTLRAGISNGFRAPSIQQRFYEGTQSFRGTALIQGIFSNISPVTKAFGIPSLEAEKSVNMSGGFAAKLSTHLNLSAQAYWIQIKNRIILSGTFRKDNADVAAKLLNYPNIDVVQFYVNAINTRTRGVDAALDGLWQFNKTRVNLSMAVNINHNTIFGGVKVPANISDIPTYANTLFGIEERIAMEKDQPRQKVVFTSLINQGKFQFRLANTFFGGTGSATIVFNPTDTLFESFSSKILTDISVTFKPKAGITLTAGVNDALDVYPDRQKNYRNFTDKTYGYSNGASPFGYNGGYYFIGASFNWYKSGKN